MGSLKSVWGSPPLFHLVRKLGSQRGTWGSRGESLCRSTRLAGAVTSLRASADRFLSACIYYVIGNAALSFSG